MENHNTKATRTEDLDVNKSAIENLKFSRVFVNSFYDVLEEVLGVLLKPNLSIGLGSGKIIDLFVEWIIDNAKRPECTSLSVFCTDGKQVDWLTKYGIKAHHGIPSVSSDTMHRLDYFFEMPELMNTDYDFVKSSPYCEYRKHLFEKADNCVFFYHHKGNTKFQNILSIPIEISPAYKMWIKRKFLSKKTDLVYSMVPMEKGDSLMRLKWVVRDDQDDMSKYSDCLKGAHGVIAHGFYHRIDGCVVEICEESIEEMFMSVTHLPILTKT